LHFFSSLRFGWDLLTNHVRTVLGRIFGKSFANCMMAESDLQKSRTFGQNTSFGYQPQALVCAYVQKWKRKVRQANIT
jgi:hypothetical protein